MTDDYAEGDVDSLGAHFRRNLDLYNVARHLQRLLPPGWRLSIGFRDGNYGGYSLADERSKNVRLPKVEKANMPMACDFAWKIYRQRESEMVAGGGGPTIPGPKKKTTPTR